MFTPPGKRPSLCRWAHLAWLVLAFMFVCVCVSLHVCLHWCWYKCVFMSMVVFTINVCVYLCVRIHQSVKECLCVCLCIYAHVASCKTSRQQSLSVADCSCLLSHLSEHGMKRSMDSHWEIRPAAWTPTVEGVASYMNGDVEICPQYFLK